MQVPSHPNIYDKKNVPALLIIPDDIYQKLRGVRDRGSKSLDPSVINSANEQVERIYYYAGKKMKSHHTTKEPPHRVGEISPHPTTKEYNHPKKMVRIYDVTSRSLQYKKEPHDSVLRSKEIFILIQAEIGLESIPLSNVFSINDVPI